MTEVSVISQGTGDQELDRAIATAGYSYDSIQDIFISTMNPWQRNVGYCALYNEAAAPLGMIIDTEPIYFDYKGKKWMIGFWKGQYDLVTGCEIGIYTKAFDLDIPGVFNGNFYNAVNDDECLQMSYTLRKNNRTLFTREGKHWWLTGFKLGEFSDPNELEMDITLNFDNRDMCDAFVLGLKNLGYSTALTQEDKTVKFTFASPHSSQPITRTPKTDYIIQRKNELLCATYQEITKPYKTFPEKLNALKTEVPEIYEKILQIGKNKQSFELFILITMIGALLLSHPFGSSTNKP
jgi:hypothetical protein